jgi:thymidylate synthase
LKHINQKTIKIVTELLNYCYHHGSDDLHIDINKENKKVIIFIKAHISFISTENLEFLKKSLNVQRLHEMEEYYWNLTGDNDTDTELSLVGMMIDEAHINYVDGEYLEITLTRIP